MRPRSTSLAAATIEPERNSMGLGATIMNAAIRGYQLLISPILPGGCRYLPTCSEYGLQAIAEHGAVRGGWLTARRLMRCHPWAGSGYDPVPPAGDGDGGRRCHGHRHGPDRDPVGGPARGGSRT